MRQKNLTEVAIMAIRVVEFSMGWGGVQNRKILLKNQHAQRELLKFENWVNGEVSKSANI